MKQFCIILISVLCGSLCFANSNGGFDRGNGGDAVVCTQPDGKITYHVLDLYELTHVNRFQLWSEVNDGNLDTILKKVFVRIESRYPKLAARYEMLYKDFWRTTIFLNGPLKKTHDEGDYIIAANCHLEQLAVQWNGSVEDQLRYHIDQILWEKLSPTDQAALVVHEMTYHLMLLNSPYSQPLSIDFRSFVAFFFSEDFYKAAPILPDYLRF